MADGVVVPTEEGTPQGGPLSPLLANVMLDELDRELERRGHAFVRYAGAPRRPEREGARVGEHAQVVLACGGELDSRPCARQRQARRTRMMLLLEALPRCDVVRLGTAVYRTVCTVVWEDGTPTNDVPPTRFGKRAAASRPACRGGKPRRHTGSVALLPHAGNFSCSSSFLRSSHSLPYLWRISPILVLPRLQWQSSSAWRQYQRAFERLQRQPNALSASRLG